MVPDPAPQQAPLQQAPAPQAPEANPFLVQEPAAPAPQVASAPRVIPPSQGAPLQVQPGAVVPSVRDPHAEFRKGSWKKPVIFGAIAAAVAGGLFYGVPEPAEETPSPLASTTAEPETVIGVSVSPEVIQDPDKPSLTNPTPEKKAEPVAEQPAVSPDRPDRSGDFADAFKSAAR